MKGFKKCNNGHYYLEEFDACPFCQGASNNDGNAVTKIVGSGNKTQPVGGFGNANTEIIQPPTIGMPKSPTPNRTVFGDEVIRELEGGKQEVEIAYRSGRKLVGWLATYSFDPLGVDYKLYEGRNEIGRNAECNITVPDKMMSGKHATILYKSGKYKIKDELSSHGTVVNDADIEDAHHELHDGDVIQLGETRFKFKSSL
jgi:pSer/pThr/pTyr-binding forkhead associated (FHA) protein